MRMIRNVLVVIFAVAVLLVGQWIHVLQNESSALRAQVEKLKGEVATQNSKYQTLYSDYLREVNLKQANAKAESSPPAPPQQPVSVTEKPVAHPKPSPDQLRKIEEDRAKIRELEARLNNLKNDTAAVDQNSKTYRQNQISQQRAQLEKLEEQLRFDQLAIKDIKDQLRTAKGETAKALRQRQAETANERNQLSQQISTLRTSLKTLNQAIDSEVHVEKSEINSEHQQLEDQLKAARLELNRDLQANPK